MSVRHPQPTQTTVSHVGAMVSLALSDDKSILHLQVLPLSQMFNQTMRKTIVPMPVKDTQPTHLHITAILCMEGSEKRFELTGLRVCGCSNRVLCTKETGEVSILKIYQCAPL